MRTRSDEPVLRFENGHTKNVVSCRFDQYKLLSGSVRIGAILVAHSLNVVCWLQVDKTLAVWDLRTTSVAQRIKIGCASVAGLDFDVRRVYCGNGDGMLAVLSAGSKSTDGVSE